MYWKSMATEKHTKRNEEHTNRDHKKTNLARIILMLGAPGSGKGTQSSILVSRLGMISVSTGAILREEAKRNTPSGFRLRQLMASGALVSDKVVCDAVGSRIRNARPGECLILDGFPRTVAQAKNLDHLLQSLGMPAPLVLHFDVPDAVLTRRLASRRQCATCGAVYNLASNPSAKGSRCQIDGGALVERDDDSEGVIARRLADYRDQTVPVIEYYRGSDYRRVDGNRDAAEIANELLDIVSFADIAAAA
jgi:adenylate kinase